MITVVIPARLGSNRLPNKPLALIGGIPMVIRTWQLAVRAGVGSVVIAGCDDAVRECAREYGAHYVHTNPDLPSGTDRVAAAIETLTSIESDDIVVNLQGDMPFFNPRWLEQISDLLEQPGFDVATAATPISCEEDSRNPNIVKVVTSRTNTTALRAIYFSRECIPWGAEPKLRHIGIYAFTRSSLRRFITLAPSPLECSEKLEQLRALENDMNIGVALLEASPVSVDTPEDLTAANAKAKSECDPI